MMNYELSVFVTRANEFAIYSSAIGTYVLYLTFKL